MHLYTSTAYTNHILISHIAIVLYNPVLRISIVTGPNILTVLLKYIGLFQSQAMC